MLNFLTPLSLSFIAQIYLELNTISGYNFGHSNIVQTAIKDTNCIVINDLKYSGLKGRVKSVKLSTYQALEKFGELTEGKLVDDSLEKNSFAQFDADGYYTKIEIYDTLCIVRERTEFKRYPKGCTISSKTWYADTLNEVNEFTYNFKDSIIEQRQYDSKNKLLFVEKSKLDKTGKLLESVKYNSEGRKTEFYMKVRAQDAPTTTTWHKYDEDGNVINTHIWVYNKKDRTQIYSFIRYIITDAVEVSSVDNFGTIEKFNEQEDLLKSRSSNSTVITTYKYDYDKNKNWTKRIEYLDGKPEKIFKRVIEYY
ncbi:hypothetical protein [Runella sp. SP2]|uniref:hypothetical protein n=1 Tax=Runella sp. SP2 TaxID=2268026 RepID=UPI000F076143|nr:hypothetical protein [Runella sp. SP2]AYQ33974.1 hypothetical protein DTQ70_18240 [Runella sp. SP2]